MQPTARSLTLDLLSTIRRGTMPVRALVAAAELFGIEENSLRVSLARLLAAGSVERDERGRYRLARTDTELKQHVLGWRELESRVVDDWMGDFAAVIGAPTGRSGSGRRSTRALELLGFRSLRPGLHVRPDNLAGGIDLVRSRYAALCEHSGAQKQEHDACEARPPLIARLCDVPGLDTRAARSLWDAAGLERDYATLRSALAASEAHLDALSPSEAMVESFLLGGRVLRALNVDPLLPEPIIDRPARRELFEAMRRYDRLGRSKWSLFLAPYDVPALGVPGADTSPHTPIMHDPEARIH